MAAYRDLGHPQDAEVYWDAPGRQGAPQGLQTITREEHAQIFDPEAEKGLDHEAPRVYIGDMKNEAHTATVTIRVTNVLGVAYISTDVDGNTRSGKTWQGALRTLRTLERDGRTYTVTIRGEVLA
jgi:hypothetical protein